MYIHSHETYNTKAAEVIIPFVFKWFTVNSVLDVGCGLGSWLKVVEKFEVNDFLGVDGDYIDRNLLKIPESKFKAYDLCKPLNLGRKYELVISLEVAEHLPEKSADIFIETLVNHGNLILFSAAIPNQGGQNHLNEQWPTYWKNKFYKHGFSFYDLIRPLVWENKSIEWWYKQNIFVVMKDYPQNNFIKKETFIDIVHPDMFLYKQNILDNVMNGKGGFRSSVKIFIRALKQQLLND